MSIDFDWRRKDRFCEAYKVLFGKAENVLKAIDMEMVKSKPDSYSKDIEHLDGNTRHLDSNLVKGHSDGITHIDGDTKHLDSG